MLLNSPSAVGDGANISLLASLIYEKFTDVAETFISVKMILLCRCLSYNKIELAEHFCLYMCSILSTISREQPTQQMLSL